MEIFDEVIKRLESFGYTYTQSDIHNIDYAIAKIGTYIKNFCNIEEIPERLQFVYIDIVCGEFLQEKKSSGQLKLSDLDLSKPALKSISEGDTNISYATGEGSQTDEQKLDSLINCLLNYQNQLYKFRRIVW